MSERKYISSFIPEIVLFNADVYTADIREFSAGKEHFECAYFLQNDAQKYMEMKEGVTYLIFDVSDSKPPRLAAFFTLSTSAIPCNSRIRFDPDEAKEKGAEYDEFLCGIPAMQIKMFAVDERYQDTFFMSDGTETLISAYIFTGIMSYLNTLSETVASFSAVYLHSLPNAENFYKKCGFIPAESYMTEFYDPDSEFTFMYRALKEIHIEYDE